MHFLQFLLFVSPPPSSGINFVCMIQDLGLKGPDSRFKHKVVSGDEGGSSNACIFLLSHCLIGLFVGSQIQET